MLDQVSRLWPWYIQQLFHEKRLFVNDKIYLLDRFYQLNLEVQSHDMQYRIFDEKSSPEYQILEVTTIAGSDFLHYND